MSPSSKCRALAMGKRLSDIFSFHLEPLGSFGFDGLPAVGLVNGKI